MSFKDDGGGFAFACDDAKLSVDASTWNTRLSQIGKVKGDIHVMTGELPDIDYIGRIIGKRTQGQGIYIIANERAAKEAQQLKNTFPLLSIALHPKTNAKIVLVNPKTVWISSEDFGRTDQKIESAIGLHSDYVYQKAHESLFMPTWEKARKLSALKVL